MTKLLIVESPNKCATIKKFLGSGWYVEASIGHITELAADGDSNLGFDLSKSHVTCRYVPRTAYNPKTHKTEPRGKQVIQRLRATVAKVDAIYLATDPDREGESISWHLLEQVCGKKPIYRVTYTQVTEAAIKAAIAAPRQLDMDLVNAQKARQCLDKLVGYKLSNLVQNAGAGRSAGRVQSVGLHLIAKREREIKNFKPVPYWALQAEYGEGFIATYLGQEQAESVEADTEAVTDDAADPAQKKESESRRVNSQEEAHHLIAIAQSNSHQVMSFSGKATRKAPPAALTTSALQQVAGVRFGFSSDQTMRLAQELFEGKGFDHGLITYHRTDSVELSPEFCDMARSWLSANHPDIVPDKATQHKTKAGAQGAHEAIRPVEVDNTPEKLKSKLTPEQLQVYSIIWGRAVASQCAPAQLEKSKAVIQAGSTFWQAQGSVLKSPGYTKIWNDLSADSQLPTLQQGQTLTLKRAWHEARKTIPPSRYSEPSLIQVLEKVGVGRPSTYATIVKTLKDRQYVTAKKVLIPTDAGMKVDDCLMQAFPPVTDTQFTARMESDLDSIAEGKLNWEQYLTRFNFETFIPALERSGVLKLTQSSGPAPRKSGTITKFVCQVCGKFLEEYRYTKGGKAKKMLRCSDLAANRQPDHENAVYFVSKKGTYWNATLQAEPTTEPPPQKAA